MKDTFITYSNGITKAKKRYNKPILNTNDYFNKDNQ